MKLTPYILLILLAFGFSACKKQHTVTIQAQNLTNLSDGSHYANKRFVIYEISYKLFGQSKAKAVVDDYFDNNGYANFELKMDKNKDYMVDVEYMDDICYLDLKTDDFLSHASTINVDFNYGACGYINLQRTSINCEGSTDKFRYKYYYTDNPDIYIYILDLYPAQTIIGRIILT